MGPERRRAARRRSRAATSDVREHEHGHERGIPETAPLALIVDDNEDNIEVYATFFAHAGWRVERAVDGEHALLKILSVMPDVVVMDLAMPILDGWEATRRIKEHPKTKHIPIVAVTGQVSAENLTRARAAGASAVVTKPCTPEVLLSLVEKVLDEEGK